MSSSYQILRGDVRARAREIPDGVVRCCVTSPPYWGLRDYGVDGQIGLEATLDQFVGELVEVFREVRRVLTDDGTLWLNLGDAYARNGGAKAGAARIGRKHQAAAVEAQKRMGRRDFGEEIKEKDLMGVPWTVALALRADGWWLRSEIIWHKTNPQPETVTDRPCRSHEHLFLLSKSPRYFYNAEAVKEPVSGTAHARGSGVNPKARSNAAGSRQNASFSAAVSQLVEKRNKRTVWTLQSRPFPGSHFATFPPELVEPCVLAGSEPGDVVFDPFSGAGTTGLVALRYGRDYLGIELNPKYAEMAEARLELDRAKRLEEENAA